MDQPLARPRWLRRAGQPELALDLCDDILVHGALLTIAIVAGRAVNVL
ncbi:MAG: hypothetical protein ACRDPT_09320 [Streptomycetales bacterium]